MCETGRFVNSNLSHDSYQGRPALIFPLPDSMTDWV